MSENLRSGNTVSPQPLDDAIWDAARHLMRLRLRIMQSNGNDWPKERRDAACSRLTQYVSEMASWLSE